MARRHRRSPQAKSPLLTIGSTKRFLTLTPMIYVSPPTPDESGWHAIAIPSTYLRVGKTISLLFERIRHSSTKALDATDSHAVVQLN